MTIRNLVKSFPNPVNRHFDDRRNLIVPCCYGSSFKYYIQFSQISPIVEMTARLCTRLERITK